MQQAAVTTDTIAALATPRGTAALAIVRVSGPESARLISDIFNKTPKPREVFRADYRDTAGRTLDDVLVTFFKSPKSYTGEDSFEITSHGNPIITQLIINDIVARGCRVAEAGEFTRRAFLNGQMDLSQAEAVADLIHARSERAIATANHQLRGSLGRQLAELIEQLLQIIAQVEAYIDFPEEDLPPENRRQLVEQLALVLRGTKRLLATQSYGDLLREGIRTVIIGAPNAGKSSLLNRLVGNDRALVSSEPGTTRDFIEEQVLLGGHCLRFVDTAGFNPTPGAIEKMGMEKAVEQAAAAHIFLWVVDARQAAARPALPDEIQRHMTPQNTLLLLNKSDLAPTRQAAALPYPHFYVSALTGDGLEEVQKAIETIADSFEQEQGEEVIVINARHADALRRVSESLKMADQKLKTGDTSEFLASDLREALNALGEITGKIDNERVLDHLFSTFCIGK